ncbi:MAG: hypothetical protein A2075_12855 [Geobacteraceae bacterium GWC2_58_44]|nr:MAG: hypothetical protein A2075_12855 [Geobacteraceae bacterium GWC2_58_44]
MAAVPAMPGVDGESAEVPEVARGAGVPIATGAGALTATGAPEIPKAAGAPPKPAGAAPSPQTMENVVVMINAWRSSLRMDNDMVNGTFLWIHQQNLWLNLVYGESPI